MKVPTPTQRAVEIALQRYETVNSMIATSSPFTTSQTIHYALSGLQSGFIGATPDLPDSTSSKLLGAGVVWYKVYAVRVSGNQATTVFCRDQRDLIPPTKGAGITALPPRVSLSAYRWWFERGSLDDELGPLVTWRATVPFFAGRGDPGLDDCQKWAKTHKTWTGPSTG